MFTPAQVVELVDTLDLKSSGQKCPYGFKSHLEYKVLKYMFTPAQVVELVDTLDLKSSGQKCPYGFKSHLEYT